MSAVSRRRRRREGLHARRALPCWRVEASCGCCHHDMWFATEARLLAAIAASGPGATVVDDAGARHVNADLVGSYVRLPSG